MNVEIYDMGTTMNAFGEYISERQNDTVTLPIDMLEVLFQLSTAFYAERPLLFQDPHAGETLNDNL